MRPKDFYNISTAHLPLLVFSDNLYSFFSWRIRCKTEGYTHAMWLYAPGRVATQGWTFKSEDISEFLGTSRMELWHNPAWRKQDRERIVEELTRKINQPLFYRMYDVLGIIGHIVQSRKFHSPFQEYCSENAGRVLSVVEPDMKIQSPTPEELRQWCKDNRQMTVYGRYHPYESK